MACAVSTRALFAGAHPSLWPCLRHMQTQVDEAAKAAVQAKKDAALVERVSAERESAAQALSERAQGDGNTHVLHPGGGGLKGGLTF